MKYEQAGNQKSSFSVVRPWKVCRIKGNGCEKVDHRGGAAEGFDVEAAAAASSRSVVVAIWLRYVRRGEFTGCSPRMDGEVGSGTSV